MTNNVLHNTATDGCRSALENEPINGRTLNVAAGKGDELASGVNIESGFVKLRPHTSLYRDTTRDTGRTGTSTDSNEVAELSTETVGNAYVLSRV